MIADNDIQNLASTGNDTEDYRCVFRKQVFQLLKWGYDRLNASEYQAAEEEDITGELAKEINAILEDRNFPEWVCRFYVHEEYHINVPERKGKRRKRLDIDLYELSLVPVLAYLSKPSVFLRGHASDCQISWEGRFRAVFNG